MRILKFIVEGMTLKRDPDCDFSGLVPGSKGYIQAEFAFSPDWDGCVKVAGFWSPFGKEYQPQELEGGVRCLIPAEALAKKSFKIQILGKKEKLEIMTNKLLVEQNGG